MRATPAEHVNHPLFRMFPAVDPSLAAHGVEARCLGAGVVGATLAANVHHSEVSVLLAVHRFRFAVEVEA